MAAGAPAPAARRVHAAATTTATKKATATADAPIWKSYLAARTEIGIGGSASWRQQVGGGASLLHGRSRKRSKPSNIYARSGSGTGNGSSWTAVPYSGSTSDEDSSVANRIRKYWEQLSANERQQILFVDEPDLVKQLYKLNLSLLCVGLMQRHLKMPLRSAVTKSTSKMVTTARSTPSLAIEDTPTAAPLTGDTPASTLTAENAVSKNASPIAEADPSVEKTYELLEAMEFMDIGTGILTVKSELVEDSGRLFGLVGEVLFGFVTTVHLLNEKQFLDLFVSESEVINTWEDYQRLIAMLVEQLILRSYVNYLEKQAAIQMEQLLLEVSLEDTKNCKNDQHKDGTSANKSKKKKKKKKKSMSSVEESPKAPHQPEPEEDVGEHGDENNSNENNIINEESYGDETAHTAIVTTKDSQEPEASPVKSQQPTKRPSILNPNASVFQPKFDVQMFETIPDHAHEKYVVRVDARDAISHDEYGFEESDLDYSSEDELGEDSAQLTSRWNQKRKREDDAELEWQLQQIYASTSTMLGWDFSRQCDVVGPHSAMPWDDSIFWRTAPKEVVRYFTPAFDNMFAPYPPPPTLQPNNSRYFFSPSPSMDPLSAAGYFPGAGGPSSHILPSRGHHPRTYAFQEADFRGVVTSPDFSSSAASTELHERLPSPERSRHGI
ncbi:hypothetical protein FI667_g6966, partial [Globisporangium splendens]